MRLGTVCRDAKIELSFTPHTVLHHAFQESVILCAISLLCEVRDLRSAGLRSGGFDGNPATWEITEGRCLQDGTVLKFSVMVHISAIFMASNLEAKASNLLAMASNLLAIASHLEDPRSNGLQLM